MTLPTITASRSWPAVIIDYDGNPAYGETLGLRIRLKFTVRRVSQNCPCPICIHAVQDARIARFARSDEVRFSALVTAENDEVFHMLVEFGSLIGVIYKLLEFWVHHSRSGLSDL
jgi:hypothetical protein